jgi:hypothetical protein
MQELFTDPSIPERPQLLQWLNNHPAVQNMNEKELLLLLLFRIDTIDATVRDILYNTKTHWVN